MNEIESIINENKADILKSMKKSYEDQIEYIGVPDDSNRFSWENNKHLKFYFTSTTYDEDLPGAYKLIIFAIKSEKDDIEYKDIIEETNNFEYSQLQISEKENYILSTFYNNTVGIIKNSLNSSVMTIFFDFNKNQLKEKFISFLNKQMKDFAIREYKSTSERLKEYPDSLISFDQKKYYVDTFEFKKWLMM
ncbi:MAG: hypothetical protein O7C56_03270 [Rickettsia endosymbiont of Ixodes persulcatus]|nr:hypothetical protein [Rickettsia endosymbiont of Ixodes persulcatus]